MIGFEATTRVLALAKEAHSSCTTPECEDCRAILHVERALKMATTISKQYSEGGESN